jgi:hypothetical protein
MAHRAAIYSVCVHPLHKPKELRPLGDFDEQGTSLAPRLNEYFNSNFEVEDSPKTAQCVSSSLAGDEVELIVTHGQSGVAADIVDTAGTVRLHQEPEDTQEIRCGSLLRIPGRETTGWWAVHVNNGRSAKSLLYAELAERFRSDFDELKLLVSPCVPGAALEQAVNEGQIERVNLIRLDRPTDRRERITDKWVRSNQSARVEVGIRAGRGEHVVRDLLARFLGGDKEAFGEIVEFNGLEFDQAKVEVALTNGTTRTFNIETPDAGHAFTVEMDQLDFEDGEPTDGSVFAELRRAIDEMA